MPPMHHLVVLAGGAEWRRHDDNSLLSNLFQRPQIALQHLRLVVKEVLDPQHTLCHFFDLSQICHIHEACHL